VAEERPLPLSRLREKLRACAEFELSTGGAPIAAEERLVEREREGAALVPDTGPGAHV